MDSLIFREQSQGSKLIRLKPSLYHWKALQTWMLKMSTHDPFEFLKHKLWPKEGPKVKLAIWLPTTKSQEIAPISLRVGGMRHTLESSWQGLQLFFICHLNQRSIDKVMGPQNRRSPNFGNFGTQDSHLGVLGQSDIWMLAPWPCTKYTIKGKVVASPKSRPWWVLWVRVCSWLVLAPKVFQLCTNQLVVWFMQVRVNKWISCQSS
jgi:hypothetical protein